MVTGRRPQTCGIPLQPRGIFQPNYQLITAAWDQLEVPAKSWGPSCKEKLVFLLGHWKYPSGHFGNTAFWFSTAKGHWEAKATSRQAEEGNQATNNPTK